jgi:hypothetical protein
MAAASQTSSLNEKSKFELGNATVTIQALYSVKTKPIEPIAVVEADQSARDGPKGLDVDVSFRYRPWNLVARHSKQPQ